MNFEEKTLKENVIYEGRIITLHVDDIELPDGSKSFREVVEHSGGVCVAAITDEDELFFVRQYRYPYGRVLLELPAGKLEKGEDPLEAGKRELQEECGVTAEEIISMGTVYPTVAYCNEIIHVYLAKDLVKTAQHLDDDEFLTVERIPFEKAVEMVMDNKIPDAKTQIAILKVYALKTMGKL